eukprot:1162075-Pelagomonas_calceolata.AAC.11
MLGCRTCMLAVLSDQAGKSQVGCCCKIELLLSLGRSAGLPDRQRQCGCNSLMGLCRSGGTVQECPRAYLHRNLYWPHMLQTAFLLVVLGCSNGSHRADLHVPWAVVQQRTKQQPHMFLPHERCIWWAGRGRVTGQTSSRTVCDRTALILDIFMQRAQTKEGKLQVVSITFRFGLHLLLTYAIFRAKNAYLEALPLGSIREALWCG